MSGDQFTSGGPEQHQIDINAGHELDYWTGQLGCTEEQLRMAVAQVGQDVYELRNHFGVVRLR